MDLGDPTEGLQALVSNEGGAMLGFNLAVRNRTETARPRLERRTIFTFVLSLCRFRVKKMLLLIASKQTLQRLVVV